MSMAAIFAALHATLYVVSFNIAFWRNFAVYIEPIEAILLGPLYGFLSAIIGSLTGRLASGFTDPLWIFGIAAESFSVLLVGFLARGNLKPILGAYSIMLLAYFIHPFGLLLPIWTILDILIALGLIWLAAYSSSNLLSSDKKKLPIALVLISFICVTTDSLIRIFLLVPIGLYNFFNWGFDTLYFVFVSSAFYSYVEDIIVVIVSLIVGTPTLLTVSKLGLTWKAKKDNS